MIQTTAPSRGASTLPKDALMSSPAKPLRCMPKKRHQIFHGRRQGAEVIVECTGFTTPRPRIAKPSPGRRKVLISAPAGEMKTIVYNVNDDTLTRMTPSSVASCTTNCLAPMASSAGCLRHHRKQLHDHHPRLYRHPVAGGRAARKRSARASRRRRKRYPAHYRRGKAIGCGDPALSGG